MSQKKRETTAGKKTTGSGTKSAAVSPAAREEITAPLKESAERSRLSCDPKIQTAEGWYRQVVRQRRRRLGIARGEQVDS